MASPQRTAVGLMTGLHFLVLGQEFQRLYPPIDHHDFGELLARIDAAEQNCPWKTGSAGYSD